MTTKILNVLIGCERSGVVREAFRRLGHNAWSCDLHRADDDADDVQHFSGDLLQYISEDWQSRWWKWDLLIAHPECTYLTCSAEWAYSDGPYHQKVKPGTLVGAKRRQARTDALSFVEKIYNAPIPKIAIENPVGVINKRLPFMPKAQYIQPYEFGHNASKKTGLWLKNLPPLILDPKKRVKGRIVTYKSKRVERFDNQTDSGQNRLSPSQSRKMDRSRTYLGIADAMAHQWA